MHKEGNAQSAHLANKFQMVHSASSNLEKSQSGLSKNFESSRSLYAVPEGHSANQASRHIQHIPAQTSEGGSVVWAAWNRKDHACQGTFLTKLHWDTKFTEVMHTEAKIPSSLVWVIHIVKPVCLYTAWTTVQGVLSRIAYMKEESFDAPDCNWWQRVLWSFYWFWGVSTCKMHA